MQRSENVLLSNLRKQMMDSQTDIEKIKQTFALIKEEKIIPDIKTMGSIVIDYLAACSDNKKILAVRPELVDFLIKQGWFFYAIATKQKSIDDLSDELGRAFKKRGTDFLYLDKQEYMGYVFFYSLKQAIKLKDECAENNELGDILEKALEEFGGIRLNNHRASLFAGLQYAMCGSLDKTSLKDRMTRLYFQDHFDNNTITKEQLDFFREQYLFLKEMVERENAVSKALLMNDNGESDFYRGKMKEWLQVYLEIYTELDAHLDQSVMKEYDKEKVNAFLSLFVTTENPQMKDIQMLDSLSNQTLFIEQITNSLKAEEEKELFVKLMQDVIPTFSFYKNENRPLDSLDNIFQILIENEWDDKGFLTIMKGLEQRLNMLQKIKKNPELSNILFLHPKQYLFNGKNISTMEYIAQLTQVVNQGKTFLENINDSYLFYYENRLAWLEHAIQHHQSYIHSNENNLAASNTIAFNRKILFHLLIDQSQDKASLFRSNLKKITLNKDQKTGFLLAFEEQYLGLTFENAEKRKQFWSRVTGSSVIAKITTSSAKPDLYAAIKKHLEDKIQKNSENRDETLLAEVKQLHALLSNVIARENNFGYLIGDCQELKAAQKIVASIEKDLMALCPEKKRTTTYSKVPPEGKASQLVRFLGKEFFLIDAQSFSLFSTKRSNPTQENDINCSLLSLRRGSDEGEL